MVRYSGGGWLAAECGVAAMMITAMPNNLDLAQVIAVAPAERADMRTALTLELNTQEHRKDVLWWAQQLDDAQPGLGIRHCLFSMLTQASSAVVRELASEIDSAEADAETFRRTDGVNRTVSVSCVSARIGPRR